MRTTEPTDPARTAKLPAVQRHVANEPLLLNLGCGPHPLREWRNFDNSPSVRLARAPRLAALLEQFSIITKEQLEVVQAASSSGITWCDATRNIPVKTASASVAYACHVLEHLDPDQAVAFIHECHRVLRPGGIIRIVVPSLDHLIEQYVQSRDAASFIEALYMVEPRPRTAWDAIRIALVGFRRHRRMYNEETLIRLLSSCGFVDAMPVAPGTTTITDPRGLDLYERSAESLYVEGRKPVSDTSK